MDFTSDSFHTGSLVDSPGQASTMPGDSIDLFKSAGAEIDVQLLSVRVVRYAVVTTLLYGAFTVLFYKGFHLTTVTETVGLSKKSEELVEIYNTYVAYVMALVELVLSMYVDKVKPVIDVYVHNVLFHLQQDPIHGTRKPKASRYLRGVLLFLFPVVFGLTMGNSIRSLQAVQTNDGFERIMLDDDLKKAQPTLERMKARAKNGGVANQSANTHSMSQDERSVRGNILKNAIRQQTTPFTIDSNSPCTQRGLTKKDEVLKIDPREAASSSVIYGFIPREWNSEAMTTVPTVNNSSKILLNDLSKVNVEALPFPTETAYEILVQAAMVIHRAYANSATYASDCMAGNNSTRCKRLGSPFTDPTRFKGEMATLFMYNLRSWINDSIQATSIRKSLDVTFETVDLTPQIQLETVQIDTTLAPNLSSSQGIQYLDTMRCGSNGCAYVDQDQIFPVQPEIGVMPYVTNCTLDQVDYYSDLRAFYPKSCAKLSDNTAFLYGYGSYIVGDEYGSNHPEKRLPYITNPSRRIRMAFAKVTWTSVNLSSEFDATCGEDSDANLNCFGLWYKLQPSDRFLFAGEHALPTDRLAGASFRSPISLVLLNSPQVFVAKKQLVSLERLVLRNFKRPIWIGAQDNTGAVLRGDKCSMIIDSYLNHINENNYFIERPMQVMYQSFFYFLMENAAVTELNDTTAALNGANTTKTALFRDKLGNVKLSGDIQVRNIRVAIPSNSFYMTVAGCICIFLGTFVIMLSPVSRVEHFGDDESKAEQFIQMSKDEDYPDEVHNKLLLLAPGDSVRFSDTCVESLVLVPKHKQPAKTIAGIKATRSTRGSRSNSRETQEDNSEGTSSEEIA